MALSLCMAMPFTVAPLSDPYFRAVQDTMTIMRAAEGVKFPQLKESDAMFSAQVPPEWEDANCCHLCRAQFSTFNRKVGCSSLDEERSTA